MKLTENIEVFNEDCNELMKRYPDNYFQLAIIDPPYGIGAGGKNFKSGTSKNSKIYRDTDWDKNIPDLVFWNYLATVSENQIVWGGNYFTEYLQPSRCWIFWDKNQPMDNYADGELAWTSFDKVTKKVSKDWYGAMAKEKEQIERCHPTQKPVQLYEWLLLNYAKPNDKILDTHFGSLSIGIAIDNVNRREKMNLSLVASELDKDYYNAAIKRFKQVTSQRNIYDEF